jgi:two-component system cell cycle sensor histidine kinase/response regulator CckA
MRGGLVARTLRTLIIEQSEVETGRVVAELTQAGFTVRPRQVKDEAALRVALHEGAWDLIVADWSTPALTAPAALAILKERKLDRVPFIVMAESEPGEEAVIAVLRAGARDFVQKRKLGRLIPTLERELRDRDERQSRAEIEAALRVSEERYRQLFDRAPQPIWTYERATLRFIEVNAAALERYGYTREEFLAMTILDLRPPEDADAVRKSVAEPKQARATRLWRHLKKDRTQIWVEVSSFDFLQAHGGEARMVLARDVTERIRADETLRKTEEQLRHALKLEAVGALAGGIAHDFNNLLFVMLSYSNLLLEDEALTPAQRADVDQIRRAAERASELTKQLLAYSRQQILQPRVLDLNQVLLDVEGMLRRVIGAPVDLQIITATALGKVHADPGQLEQIIVNLIINARDAMPRGGRIALETRNVKLDAPITGGVGEGEIAPGSYVVLSVSDTGTGMLPSIRARIFDPFFTTKEKGKGTGLGLATVSGIVKQSGGHILVESEPGRGSCFQIYLPATDRIEEPVKTSSSPGLRLSGSETVLLVEDEEQVRVVTATILRKAGYHVLEAKNGGEALLTCELHAGRIELLLTDVIMPMMSGPQLAGRLAPLRPTMKVLFMSGFTDNAMVRDGVVAQDVHFLQKPAAPRALLTSVRQVLDG